jgi:flagellar biosynthesis/type III secretory pathway M-ring protein FliF/YscJ
MDSTVVQYLGFIVAAFILIWAVIEINRRLYRRNKPDRDASNQWVELDTKRPEARDGLLAGALHTEEEDEEEEELHTRSKQNGHHRESQRPQI